MQGKPKKSPRHKDMTSEYMTGGLDEDRVESKQRFTDRAKHYQRDKTLRTAIKRHEKDLLSGDIETLPIGRVTQVYSVYCTVVPLLPDDTVDPSQKPQLCVVRKTLTKVHGEIIVGDRVRFRSGDKAESTSELSTNAKSPDAVIEQVLPRATLLTRSDSFKGISSHAIVANADQVLIVASLRLPRPKWGLIDRMIVASQAGSLRPIVCLNKIDLADDADDPESSIEDLAFAIAVLDHYASMNIGTVKTSVERNVGLAEIRAMLSDKITVLAGHSGVGKSSLIRAVQPAIDLRVGEVSAITQKGRHTTTSAKYYDLEGSPGAVIDTPGVKLFGLWNVTRDTLINHFPDVDDDTAPAWRKESYERILRSLSDKDARS